MAYLQMSLNEVLMNLYIVMLAIELAYILIEANVDNWFHVMKYQKKKPFNAYMLFLVFFGVNLIYLYVPYLVYNGSFELPGLISRFFTTFDAILVKDIIHDMFMLSVLLVPVMTHSIMCFIFAQKQNYGPLSIKSRGLFFGLMMIILIIPFFLI